jgi:hypothetical protein
MSGLKIFRLGPDPHGKVMTRLCLSHLSLSLLMTCALVPPASAAEKEGTHTPPKHATGAPAVQRLGGTGSWNAYLYKETSGRVCYLAGGAQKTEPVKFKRGLPAAEVYHRPDEHSVNVISFKEGTPLKEGSAASLDVGGAHFDLFTKDDTAWSRTAELDKTIVQAMAKGRHAVLKATPQKGPPLTDTYSLFGFAQTLALIDKACGVQR